MKVHIRKMDNLHIVLWIVKDISWMLGWKVFGTIMAVPTIAVAFMICYYSRMFTSRLFPNLAVLCWICANSVWMIGEFFNLRILNIALFLFIGGFIIMGVFNLRKV